MTMQSCFRLSLVAVAAAGLAACGGGGGGDSSANSAPDTFKALPLKTEADTGVLPPKLALIQSQAQARDLVVDLLNAYAKAAEGIAGQKLGKLAAGANPNAVDCGANRTSAGSAQAGFTYNFSGCSTDDYAFSGQATTQPATAPAADGSYTYKMEYDGILVTGPNRLSSTPLKGYTVCTVTGSTTKCVAKNDAPALTNSNFLWGWDSSLSPTDTANGTHGCGCDATWNVTYYDFTSTGGQAIIQGSNGIGYITRKDGATFDVRLIVGGAGVDYSGPNAVRIVNP